MKQYMPRLRSSAAPLCVIVCTALVGSLLAAKPDDPSMLPIQFRKLLPLHTRLGEPKPHDWLAEHAEPGQTFRQYLHQQPVTVDKKRRVIYVQPLGDFTATEKKIVDETAEFLGVYFQLPVKIREGLPLDLVPESARRKSGAFRKEQILTTYVLSEVLKPRLPNDAVAFIAFTTSDLWPGKGWNYVFGQASLSDRVGIWSINRYGNPDVSEATYRLCLLRTLKTATHETGHMFTMAHCTLYECNMCGSNHLEESDHRPLELCPHCLAKLCYATDADPTTRFEKLIEFYRDHDLTSEQAFCEKSLALLEKR